MAKIKAKTQATAAASVELEGKLHDLALLTAQILLTLGQSTRQAMKENGTTQIEPEGTEPNDFALALWQMRQSSQIEVGKMEKAEATPEVPDASQ